MPRPKWHLRAPFVMPRWYPGGSLAMPKAFGGSPCNTQHLSLLFESVLGTDNGAPAGSFLLCSAMVGIPYSSCLQLLVTHCCLLLAVCCPVQLSDGRVVLYVCLSSSSPSPYAVLVLLCHVLCEHQTCAVCAPIEPTPSALGRQRSCHHFRPISDQHQPFSWPAL